MKKLLLIIALLISVLGLNAQSVTIGDLEFTVTSEAPAECEVSGYSGKPTDVTIPSTVTISGKEYSVTSIGYEAFRNCLFLRSIEIPSGVTSIGDYAFKTCIKLIEIEIPSGVTSIGQDAFAGCNKLTSIEIPSGVTSIGNNAFYYCNNLTSIVVESGNTVYDSRDNCNAIIETATNTLIAGCQNTVIPSSVTSIGTGAFYGCSGLTSVTFGENSQLTSIGEDAFRYCSLTSIEIPSGVTSIGEDAFFNCLRLTSIEIPSGVTSIGTGAFNACDSLTSIIVESGNTVYDSRDNCNAIIETATNTLIAGCKNTVIPNTVSFIGEGAFSGCSSLTSIEIPSGVTSIGDYAFNGSSLTSIEIPSGVTSIGNLAFGGCSSLTSIEIPSGVTSIGEGAFMGCSSLTSIEIPSGVTSIGDYVFSVCSSLTSIEIPSGVTSIGDYAFVDCSSLTSIYCYAETVPETSQDAFSGCPSNMVIYVPAQSANDYNAKSPWKNYTIIALPCVVTASTNPEEAGVITGTGEYELSDTVTLTATANEGYKFVSWTENGELVSIEENYIFTIKGNRNLVAKFEKTYEITATVNPEKVGVVMGKGVYSHGDNVTLAAIPVKTGYEFVNWTEDGEVVSEDVEYSFVATSDRELIANFVLLDYYVSAVANAAEAGEILGSGNYNHGEDVTLTAVANEGYKFVNWTEDGEVISSVEEYSFVIIKDRNLVANFSSEDIALNVVATAIDDNTIKVEWNAVESAESYNVYRASLTRNSEYEFIANVKETSFTDTELDANTKYFYSVTAVYADGSESEKSESAEATTKPESIEELSLSFNIYPNPVNDNLYIETQTQILTQTIEIYDAFGRQQLIANGQQPTAIDVSNLNSGVYFIKIKTNDGVITKRFVKN